MIAYIKGVLVEKEPTRAVIEAAGVGYELLIPLSTYDQLPRVGENVKLLAWHCVREDDEILFGFADSDERELFLKLTSVSGVGPKIAIAILSGSSVSELSLAIAAGEAKRLSSIKGVGKKTAEKICLELRDKVNAFAARAGGKAGVSPAVKDALMALQALGFAADKASEMIADVLAKNPELTETDRIIRLALAGK